MGLVVEVVVVVAVIVVMVVAAVVAAAAVSAAAVVVGLFNLCNVVMLPEQLNPSPKYPPIQVQVKFPGVLVQYACGLQPPSFTAHSSTSVYVAVAKN